MTNNWDRECPIHGYQLPWHAFFGMQMERYQNREPFITYPLIKIVVCWKKIQIDSSNNRINPKLRRWWCLCTSRTECKLEAHWENRLYYVCCSYNEPYASFFLAFSASASERPKSPFDMLFRKEALRPFPLYRSLQSSLELEEAGWKVAKAAWDPADPFTGSPITPNFIWGSISAIQHSY